MSTLSYIRNLITDPNIASITPTSSWGVKRVCKDIDFDVRNCIVEYGPGTGVFTKFLLSHLTPDSKLILVEKNPNFVSILNKCFQQFDNVLIYNESAECVDDILTDCGEKEANYILSGIPFSFFSDQLRDDIISKTYSILRDGGHFLPYQTFFQKDSHLKSYLMKYFEVVEDNYFLRNIPPMRTYKAKKETNAGIKTS
ncbi:class I SAM-dependent methyltransferase [Evansella sp. AB-rgal1]|uniref:class I SAM-dependent methyltransferase n=1 Tax=Evansella sp. AB-rgal1 TaxID=3242696 RepID=UPI00359D271E